MSTSCIFGSLRAGSDIMLEMLLKHIPAAVEELTNVTTTMNIPHSERVRSTTNQPPSLCPHPHMPRGAESLRVAAAARSLDPRPVLHTPDVPAPRPIQVPVGEGKNRQDTSYHGLSALLVLQAKNLQSAISAKPKC